MSSPQGHRFFSQSHFDLPGVDKGGWLVFIKNLLLTLLSCRTRSLRIVLRTVPHLRLTWLAAWQIGNFTGILRQGELIDTGYGKTAL